MSRYDTRNSATGLRKYFELQNPGYADIGNTGLFYLFTMGQAMVKAENGFVLGLPVGFTRGNYSIV